MSTPGARLRASASRLGRVARRSAPETVATATGTSVRGRADRLPDTTTG